MSIEGIVLVGSFQLSCITHKRYSFSGFILAELRHSCLHWLMQCIALVSHVNLLRIVSDFHFLTFLFPFTWLSFFKIHLACLLKAFAPHIYNCIHFLLGVWHSKWHFAEFFLFRKEGLDDCPSKGTTTWI